MAYISFSSTKLHITVCWNLIARDLTGFLCSLSALSLLTDCIIVTQRRKRSECLTALQCTEETIRYQPICRTVHAVLYGELQYSVSIPPDLPVCLAHVLIFSLTIQCQKNLLECVFCLIEMYRKYVWQIMTTGSTILLVMTNIMN